VVSLLCYREVHIWSCAFEGRLQVAFTFIWEPMSRVFAPRCLRFRVKLHASPPFDVTSFATPQHFRLVCTGHLATMSQPASIETDWVFNASQEYRTPEQESPARQASTAPTPAAPPHVTPAPQHHEPEVDAPATSRMPGTRSPPAMPKKKGNAKVTRQPRQPAPEKAIPTSTTHAAEQTARSKTSTLEALRAKKGLVSAPPDATGNPHVPFPAAAAQPKPAPLATADRRPLKERARNVQSPATSNSLAKATELKSTTVKLSSRKMVVPAQTPVDHTDTGKRQGKRKRVEPEDEDGQGSDAANEEPRTNRSISQQSHVTGSLKRPTKALTSSKRSKVCKSTYDLSLSTSPPPEESRPFKRLRGDAKQKQQPEAKQSRKKATEAPVAANGSTTATTKSKGSAVTSTKHVNAAKEAKVGRKGGEPSKPAAGTRNAAADTKANARKKGKASESDAPKKNTKLVERTPNTPAVTGRPGAKAKDKMRESKTAAQPQEQMEAPTESRTVPEKLQQQAAAAIELSDYMPVVRSSSVVPSTVPHQVPQNQTPWKTPAALSSSPPIPSSSRRPVIVGFGRSGPQNQGKLSPTKEKQLQPTWINRSPIVVPSSVARSSHAKRQEQTGPSSGATSMRTTWIARSAPPSNLANSVDDALFEFFKKSANKTPTPVKAAAAARTLPAARVPTEHSKARAQEDAGGYQFIDDVEETTLVDAEARKTAPFAAKAVQEHLTASQTTMPPPPTTFKPAARVNRALPVPVVVEPDAESSSDPLHRKVSIFMYRTSLQYSKLTCVTGNRCSSGQKEAS
jgi:hypothetical protein